MAHAGEDTTVHERDRGGSRDEGGVVATELYDGVHGGRGEREAGRVRVREGTSSASTSGGRSGARTCIARGSEQGTRQQWRARSVHGRHAQATRHPLGHFREHLASNGLNMVERRFGPAMGRFGSWDQNEVCSTRPALRFLFNVPDHLSSVTAGN